MNKTLLREIIREIILEETTVVNDAKMFIQTLFARNKGKLPSDEVMKMKSGRYFKANGVGEMAGQFVWNNLVKANKIQKQGKTWVYQN